MSLYKNCGCKFEFSVKSYVRNTIILSCAKIVFPSVIDRQWWVSGRLLTPCKFVTLAARTAVRRRDGNQWLSWERVNMSTCMRWVHLYQAYSYAFFSKQTQQELTSHTNARFKVSGMWRRVLWYIGISVEEPTTFYIFSTLKKKAALSSDILALSVTSQTTLIWTEEEQKLPGQRTTLHNKDLRRLLGYDVIYWKGGQ